MPRRAGRMTAAAHIACIVKHIAKKFHPQQIIVIGSRQRSEAGWTATKECCRFIFTAFTEEIACDTDHPPTRPLLIQQRINSLARCSAWSESAQEITSSAIGSSL